MKVSVIIPFYNVETYFRTCLDSVVNQTFTDIEIILINDASKDSSRDIASEYAASDNRIKIIDLPERKGQGYARNRGIEQAAGEYIVFVDSDDFCENTLIQQLYEKATTDNTDITMCLVREYDEVNNDYITSDYYSLKLLERFQDRVFSAEETKETILDINVALWNKIYKKEFLINTGEKFPEGFIYEDLPFFFGTYCKAERISIVWRILYNYRINIKNSTMRQFNDKILDRITMVADTYNKIKSTPWLSDMLNKVKGWIIDDIFHRYTLLKQNYYREYFYKMKRLFQDLHITDLEAKDWDYVYHFEAYRLVLNCSYEEFHRKLFCDYVDIHEVEKRLYSLQKKYDHKQYLNFKGHLDEVYFKISKIYDAISENYEYTNKLYDDATNLLLRNVEELNNEITKANEHANQISDYISGVKLGEVYDEISKNYEYTNKIAIDAKYELNKKIDSNVKEIYDKFTQFGLWDCGSNIYKFQSDFNEKISSTFNNISQLSEEISEIRVYLAQCHDKTRESDADGEVQNTSPVVFNSTQSIIETNKILVQKIDKLYSEIKNVYDYITGLKEFLNNETELKISGVKNSIAELYKYSDTVGEKTASDFEKLLNEYSSTTSAKYDDIINYIKQVKKSLYECIEKNNLNILSTETNLKNSIDECEKRVVINAGEIKDDVYREIKKYHNYADNIKDAIITDTDRKIAAVNNEVSQIYTYADTKAEFISATLKIDFDSALETLKNDFKDLSSVVYNNKEECVCRTNELNNVISEASAQNFSACEELRLKINELENRLCGIDYLINEKFNELTQDFNVFKNDTFAAFENERNKYNELKTDYENRISELTNNIDEKYRVTINSLKKDFEKEIAALKEQTKSPLVKLKEKIKGHN